MFRSQEVGRYEILVRVCKDHSSHLMPVLDGWLEVNSLTLLSARVPSNPL